VPCPDSGGGGGGGGGEVRRRAQLADPDASAARTTTDLLQLSNQLASSLERQNQTMDLLVSGRECT
jgi:hypothetical protein